MNAKESFFSQYRPVHPGRVLYLEMQLVGLTVGRAAKYLNMDPNELLSLTQERSRITPEVALRLGQATPIPTSTWMTMQYSFDMREIEVMTVDGVTPFPASKDELPDPDRIELFDLEPPPFINRVKQESKTDS